MPADVLPSVLQHYLWPFLRIGAVFMIVPVLGQRSVPVRLRVLLAVALTLIVAPLLPAQPAHPVGSAPWIELFLQQFLVGLAIGFALLLVFESVLMGGELIAYGMGLGFAQLTDPLRGINTPVVGQFLTLFITLLFLALDGLQWLVALMVESFSLRPVGGAALGLADGWALLQFAAVVYWGGLQLALPIMAALLMLNLTLGVISRSAPALNLFAVGFPVTLLAGVALLWLGLPSVEEGFGQRLMETLDWLRDWLAVR